jgi:SAM-dependent methyltransferase
MSRLKELEGTFDLVLAMHVLEHDDDTAGLLARIVAMARPGGTVVLEVPNIDCFWTSLLGQAWDAWYVPFHRTHFNKPSLTGLVERCGLEVVQTVDVCLPTMGRTLANAVGVNNGLPFLLAGIALHPLQWLGEKLSRQPSALRVVARRGGPSHLQRPIREY